jgi:hypothetical protein
MIVSRDKAAPQMLCQSSGDRHRDSREPNRFGWSGKQRRRLGELHERPALVQGEPAVGNRNQT